MLNSKNRWAVSWDRRRVFTSRFFSPQELVAVVDSLRKEYKDKKASSIFKKKKKVAVKNLSFRVKKGSSILLHSL